MKVYLICDDIDQHDLNCPCESCNFGGRSYGVSIYPFTCSCNEQNKDCLHEDMYTQEQEPIKRIYACSEESASHNANIYCEKNNFAVIK